MAVGNLKGNRTPEIIVGNGAGGNGRVELFGSTGKRFRSFRAFNDRSAVHVTAKDVDRLGVDKIVTSPSASSEHRWRVWDADTNQFDEVMENDPDLANGFFVARRAANKRLWIQIAKVSPAANRSDHWIVRIPWRWPDLRRQSLTAAKTDASSRIG